MRAVYKKLSKSVILSAVAGLFSLVLATSGAVAGGLYDPGEKSSRIKVGGAVLVKPTYEGSSEYEVLGFPYVSLDSGFDGRLTIDGADSIKYAIYKHNGLEIGPLAGYRFGRDEDDGDRLHGLGDVDGGFVLGGFVKYWMGNYYLGASYHHQIGGDDTGYEIKLRAGTEKDLTSRVKLSASVGTTYSSEDYMDAYFGVSSTQAANSALSAFDADAGFKSVDVTLGLTVQLSDRWEAKLQGTYAHLLGDAADSPVVEDEGQFIGVFGLAYAFDWTR